MPANIAHMLIAHKSLELLKTKGFPELAAFATTLDTPTTGGRYRAYVNLGSIGPDLYYFASMARSTRDMLLEGFIEAAGVVPWSYHLHSQRPNEFPLRLSQILFKDAVEDGGHVLLEDDDRRRLAYIAGHLSHIAADQMIHPLVNEIAKPYYRDGRNRRKHRQCEVFQDYFLYEEVYRPERERRRGRAKAKYEFFKQDFHKWADCVTGRTLRNTEDWFRYFLQRGFAETYGPFPTEDDIENSVDNLLLVLRVCKSRGPYDEARKEYEQYGQESGMYQEYIARPRYLDRYEQAVRLSAVYIAALYEVYSILVGDGDFGPPQKERFCRIVSDADLSAPLRQRILENASAELTREDAGGTKYKALLE